ncbi:MAG: hypothetical protein IH586_10260 [Anaerolineaceae bacterium]|nr:hypothetical protein [Anaerolineaceae bacterium]
MLKIKNHLISFLAVIILIAFATLLGPEEKSLGASVRVVYLHGAWVLAAEVAFLAAALVGAAGWLARTIRQAAAYENTFHRWSAALGRTGIIFWLTYLPLSLWAMQANWNGLFLTEPRFQFALNFAIAGILLQAGMWIFHKPLLISAANIAYFLFLRISFATAKNIMHPPPSPIFSSGLWNVIVFFVALNLLTWLAAYLLTRWFFELEPANHPVIG